MATENGLLLLRSRSAWRSWLEKNHRAVKAVWLAHYKKGSGKTSVAYEDAVEEALCFGWIDGKKKSIDEGTYACRFTPRGAKSAWSELNIKRVKQLIRSEKMTQSGLEAFQGHEDRRTRALPTRLPSSLEKRFQSEKAAWRNFSGFSPSYQKLCIGWIASAKQEETQLRRLSSVISHSAKNQRVKFM